MSLEVQGVGIPFGILDIFLLYSLIGGGTTSNPYLNALLSQHFKITMMSNN